MTAKMSYEIRPSKAITRLVFVDVLRRLATMANMQDYQYVGFGALEFIDFELIHRQLGITDMISIESDPGGIDRYQWNRPFNNITLLAGRSSTVLPTINWARLSVVWLDYTSKLIKEVIADCETLAHVLIPGSVLAVTINAHPASLMEGRRTVLENAIGSQRVPIGVTDNRLGGWGLARVQYSVLTASLQSVFAVRSDAASWRQLLNVTYQDRAQMQMIAGIVGAPALDHGLDQLRFQDLPEVRTGSDALDIRVPLLTNRERAWAEQHLPLIGAGSTLSIPGVDERDLKAYSQVYRRMTQASGLIQF
jgi:hypothetical protein